jgi:hypothetical protein
MTKEQIRDLIRHKISGGDLTSDLLSRYHGKFIDKYIELGFNTIVGAVSDLATKSNDYGLLDYYIKAFKVPVTCDTYRDEYYSILPCPIVPLPMARGIRMISPMKGQGMDFIYRENNSANIYDELECGLTSDYITYYPEGNKVFYGRNMTPELTELLFKVLPTFSAWSDTDEIPLPTGKEMELIEKVCALIMQKPQEDRKSDAKAGAFNPRQEEKEDK